MNHSVQVLASVIRPVARCIAMHHPDSQRVESGRAYDDGKIRVSCVVDELSETYVQIYIEGEKTTVFLQYDDSLSRLNNGAWVDTLLNDLFPVALANLHNEEQERIAKEQAKFEPMVEQS